MHHWVTDSDPALFVSGFQHVNKKLHLPQSSKIKGIISPKTVVIRVFLLFYLMMAGSGSGSWRPKTYESGSTTLVIKRLLMWYTVPYLPSSKRLSNISKELICRATFLILGRTQGGVMLMGEQKASIWNILVAVGSQYFTRKLCAAGLSRQVLHGH